MGKAARGGILRSTLVGVQVAVCMVLLIAAGLLMRGLYLAQTVDPGFEMKGIMQAQFDLPSQGYSKERAQAFQRELIARVEALPAVDEVEQARVTPLSHQFLGTGLTLAGETEARGFEFNVVSAGFFRMLRMPMVRGQTFTEAETRSGAPVLVVTESTARKLWPGQDALGKTLRGVVPVGLQWEKRSLIHTLEQLDQLKRIDACALDRKAPMKVWSRDAAGGAHFSEHLAVLQCVAGFHIDLRKVSIKRVNPQSMIDNDGIAGKKQLLGKGYAATLSRMNGSARQRGEIHAAVRRPGLAVQNAALAKIAASGHAIQRDAKIAVP